MRGIHCLPGKEWWYTKLSRVLAELGEGEGFEDAMVVHAEAMREQLMEMIAIFQPYGHEEWDPESHYRRPADARTVSDRIGHTAIEDGWRYTIGPHGAKPGVSLQVSNVSEHIKYVVFGAPRHEIPFDPKVHFWWGDPQRWPAPDYDAEGKPMGPGYYTYSFISHPGQEPNPFVKKAKDAASGNMADTAREGVAEYLTEMMAKNGLNRIR